MAYTKLHTRFAVVEFAVHKAVTASTHSIDPSRTVEYMMSCHAGLQVMLSDHEAKSSGEFESRLGCSPNAARTVAIPCALEQ